MRHRKKHFIFFLFLILLLPAALLSQEETVRFWTALPEPDFGEMAKLVQQYNSANPNHAVTYKNFSSSDELLQALQQESPPELALIDSRWIGNLKDKLIPSGEILEKAGEMARVMAESDTFKPIWNSCVLDGKSYCIPFSAETAALVLNREFFGKIPSVSTVGQWEKIATSLKRLKNTWGIVLPFAWSPDDLGQLWEDFAQTFLRKSNAMTGIHEEMAALNTWWNWTNRLKILPLEPYSAQENFDRAASWILFPRDVAQLKGGFVVKPLPRANAPWGYLRVSGIAFFKGFDNWKEEDSWDFANYLTSYDQLKFWSMNTPTVPVNKQVYLSPDYLHGIDADRRWMRIYIWGIVHAVPPTNVQGASETLKNIGAIVVKSLKKEVSEQEAIQEIARLTR